MKKKLSRHANEQIIRQNLGHPEKVSDIRFDWENKVISFVVS